MVKQVADERKWIDSILLPRRHREDFNDEYDSIASKVAKEWLADNNYELCSIEKIIMEFGLRTPVDFGIGPDLIVKKNNEVFFVQRQVNQAKPKNYSKTSLKIAKEHGFRTMTIKLDVEIKVGEISLTEI